MWGCGSCRRRWLTSFPRDGLRLRPFQDGDEKGYGLADVHGESIESGWSAHNGVLFGVEAARIGGTSNDLSPLPGKANPEGTILTPYELFELCDLTEETITSTESTGGKHIFSVPKRRNIVRSFVASFHGDKEVGCLINPCPRNQVRIGFHGIEYSLSQGDFIQFEARNGEIHFHEFPDDVETMMDAHVLEGGMSPRELIRRTDLEYFAMD